MATALVIDDEVMVRRLVRRMLEPDLCRVLEAEDGEAGLRLVEQHRELIDLVLTDLVMPGIDGYDVVEVLTAHCPDLPVVCMSGFARHPATRGPVLVPFLPKPFSLGALRKALAPLLDQRLDARRISGGGGNGAAAEESGTPESPRRRGAEHADGAEGADLVALARELCRRRTDRSSV